MTKLLIIAAVLGASVIVLAGWAWAGTCQTQCWTYAGQKTCRTYCW
jgi:hypothetical protein